MLYRCSALSDAIFFSSDRSFLPPASPPPRARESVSLAFGRRPPPRKRRAMDMPRRAAAAAAARAGSARQRNGLGSRDPHGDDRRRGGGRSDGEAAGERPGRLGEAHLCGHCITPYLRHSFFSAVVHMPNFFATCRRPGRESLPRRATRGRVAAAEGDREALVRGGFSPR